VSSSPVQRRTSRGSARAHLDSACDKRAHHDRASFCGCPGAPLERRGVNPRLAGVGGQTNGTEDLWRRLLCLRCRLLRGHGGASELDLVWLEKPSPILRNLI
jgi:hypothetical protein